MPDSGENKGLQGQAGQVVFLGAGPGDPELLTIKGKRLLEAADLVVYAGSLVNEHLLEYCRQAELVDSAPLNLEEIIKLMADRAHAGQLVIRLHSGDPSLYGAINEQISRLAAAGIGAAVVPGVTSLSASAAALTGELTVPGVSQTVIITRAAGRTPVPEREDIAALARHGATMAIFLSAGLVESVREKLLACYPPATPVAVVQRASWPDEKLLRTDIENMATDIGRAGVDRTAMIIVGRSLEAAGDDSRLYAEDFRHGYRRGATEGEEQE